MKKLLLSVVAFSAITVSVNAQAVAKVLEPANIVGNKEMSWADPATWGMTPDFNVPGTFVEDTLALAIDANASSGNNPLGGHEYIYEGCGPFTNASAVAGKIAVVYRGTCEFGMKALNAMNAGAVGVIILNRDPEVIAMGAGASGATVDIPVVMLNSIDRDLIRTELDAPNTVIMFLGNKQGLNSNDLGFNSEGALPPPYATMNKTYQGLAFTPFLEVFNYGSTNQTASKAIVTVKNAANTMIHTDTVDFSLNAGDDLFIATGNPEEFSEFNPGNLPNGAYTLTYEVKADGVDDDASDNILTYTFNVTDNLVGLAPGNASNGNLPLANSYPSNSTGIYTACMTLEFPATFPAGAGVTAFHYYPEADTSVTDLSGSEVIFRVYEWNDTSTVATSIVEIGSYSDYLTSKSDTRKLRNVALPFADQIELVGGQLYLACLETGDGANVAFGYDNTVDYSLYTRTGERYSGPILVVQQGTPTWFRGAWNGVSALSLTLDINQLSGIEEAEVLAARVYPNPANDEVNVQVNGTGKINIVVTDISGKIVINTTSILSSGNTALSTQGLEAGMYVFTLTTENGQSTSVNVVKN